jgi:hypothetical protein
MRKPVPKTGWRKALDGFSRGLMFVLKPLQIVGNFVFLGLAYILGVGVSSVLWRLGPGRRARAAAEPQTWWRELPPASRDKESWLRPF